EAAAGTGISRTHLALRCTAGRRDLGLDRPPGAETGVEQAHRLEPRERGAVIGEMLRLAADRPVPREAEPRQVGNDRSGKMRSAPGVVDVLDAQEKPPTGRTRRFPAIERRADMAEMEIAGRARREPGHDPIV